MAIDVGERAKRMAKTPEGVVAIVAGFVAFVAAVQANPLASPFIGVLAFAVAYAAMWLLRYMWERYTWPTTPPFARPRQTGSRSMLREDTNAHFFKDRGAFLFTRRYFFVATATPPYQVSTDFFTWAVATQQQTPAKIGMSSQRTHWWFEDRFYWENEGYAAQDVLALIRDRERRKDRQLSRAHDLLVADATPGPRRQAITREMRRAVWERDCGACTECSRTFDLQYDHIIPVAMGGATSIENLQLLCSDCNRRKSDSL